MAKIFAIFCNGNDYYAGTEFKGAFSTRKKAEKAMARLDPGEGEYWIDEQNLDVMPKQYVPAKKQKTDSSESSEIGKLINATIKDLSKPSFTEISSELQKYQSVCDLLSKEKIEFTVKE